MKKIRLLALTLAAAIMLMGVAYAYWTDSLVIENSVTTGEMNVEFTKYMFKPSVDPGNYLEFNPPITNGPTDVPDPKLLRFELENLYPGAAYIAWAKLQNKGTIPAVFAGSVVGFDTDAPDILKENILVGLHCYLYKEDGTVKSQLPVKTDVLLRDLQGALDEVFAGVRLEPGDYIALQGEGADEHMTYKLNPELTEDMGENESIGFSVTINWKQHNAQ